MMGTNPAPVLLLAADEMTVAFIGSMTIAAGSDNPQSEPQGAYLVHKQSSKRRRRIFLWLHAQL
jgi:hypothetical protein